MTQGTMYAASGVWGLFSVDKVLQWAGSPSTGSGLLAVLGVLGTVCTWVAARRADSTRNAIERQRLIDQAERDKRLADAINEIRIHQIEAGAVPVRPDRQARLDAAWPPASPGH